ncbi:MAG: TolC family protein [Polyangiaceae bacterium]|nr:TolC family protein [Myxococcales bacterium]MCB9589203.1 TolC family protein [Polyangiaceae bacterium]
MFQINPSHTVRLLAALACGILAPACASSTRIESPVRYSGSAGVSPARASADTAKLRKAPNLSRKSLVSAVLERNPEIESMRQAYTAARARPAQVSTLPDPMLMYEFAPLSIGASDVPYGQTIKLSQRFPWPGKLSGSEDKANAEAEVVEQRVEITRLDLAKEASTLYDDYWLVGRALETNAEHRELLKKLAEAVRAQYAVGRGQARDQVAVDVELAQLERQDLVLSSDQESLRAQLNVLMHEPPDAPLPKPPRKLDVATEAPPSSPELQRIALGNRAELRAVDAEVRAAEAAGEVAERQYYPDITVSGTYTSMFRMTEHQWMLGVELPLPIAQGSRDGAVDEANARAASARGRVKRVADQLRLQVDEQRRRLLQAIAIVKLYEKRLVPVAKQQVSVGLGAYQTSGTDFSDVISAENKLRDIQLAELMAWAELSKRRAELCRAVGQPAHQCRLGGAK